MSRLIFLSAVNFGVSSVILANLLHLRHFGDVITIADVSIAWQVARVWRSVLALLAPTDVLLIADVLVLGCLFALWAGFRAGQRSRRVAALLLAAGLMLSSVTAMTIVADRDEVFSNTWQWFRIAKAVGLLNYHAWELCDHVAARAVSRRLVTAQEKELIRQALLRRRERAQDLSPLFGVARAAAVLRLSDDPHLSPPLSPAAPLPGPAARRPRPAPAGTLSAVGQLRRPGPRRAPVAARPGRPPGELGRGRLRGPQELSRATAGLRARGARAQ